MVELSQAMPSISGAYVAVSKDPDADICGILWEDKTFLDGAKGILWPAYLSYMDSVDKTLIALEKLISHKGLQISPGKHGAVEIVCAL
ncbi:MAG: hypothetical protein M1839_003540 [Geoglossum umbratile]|nr:MAG: hypothetical protein M1839_003540 [Geoglossum umbratile]